ncbi:MAG: nickel pincer cofactor biosynthesis protein LarB [Thermoanaerobaculia bacterium]
MTPERIRELLSEVARGRRSVEEALGELRELPYADLGFAKLDLHRELRHGHPEVVYAAGKREDDLRAICERLLAAHGRLLVTRIEEPAAARLMTAFPGARYADRGRVLAVGAAPALSHAPIAVLSAGTSDLPVAEEAAECLAFFGHPVVRMVDVGIAGVHRLFAQLEAMRSAPVLIAVAGMDGALPTLVAGLVAAPVVAVPTSVGYGAAFGGLAPLLTMLNACAAGVAVVNIDNGFGAAALASRIVQVTAHQPT